MATAKHLKTTKYVFVFAVLLCLCRNIYGQQLVKPIVYDRLQPAAAVSLNGFVGNEMEASRQHRILAQDVERLIEPFKNRSETRCWQTEFWGKWFTSAVLAYRYRPDAELKSVLDKAVTGLIATQTPDGYIGNYTSSSRLQQWDIWGQKYCMLGLLAYFDLTKDKLTLAATRKLADNLINELQSRKLLIVKTGNHRGMAASSVLEPICLLYTRTGNKRYLDFAEEIVTEWESDEGPKLLSKASTNVAERFPKPQQWFGWEQGQKAYEMMSCYEGLLELYRITGKTIYKTAVEKTWQNIYDTEINIVGSGSAMECWFGGAALQPLPITHYQETCVTATWIKLSQQLLRLTGDAKYADAIEQTFYNALLGAMKPDGSDWAKYSPLSGQRLQGEEQCGMGLNCCVASGPRGLFTIPLTAIMQDKEGLRVNFFIDGSYIVKTPTGQSVNIIQQTDYPVTGDITLKVSIAKPEDFDLSLRIPSWSEATTVSVNGQAQTNILPAQYSTITRTWRAGDVVTIHLDMRGRLVKIGQTPQYVSILRGPVVLARDARIPGPDVEEVINPVVDKNGRISLDPIPPGKNNIWMQFNARFLVESHKEGGNQPVIISLCDYASAGNTNDDSSRFRVWLPQFIDPRNL